jgi:hypothetical protein
MALATLSGAQANCVDPITNTTTPNPWFKLSLI